MMMHSKVPMDAKIEAPSPTLVCWDINRCPVPVDVDSSSIGPCIRRAVNNLGYMGPLTITAIGRLTDIPLDILQAIYSSGIALHHVPTDNGIDLNLFLWGWNNPPPANLLLISDYRIFGPTLGILRSDRYNIIESICSPSSAYNHISIWQSFLTMLRAGELKGEVGDNCNEKSALVCSTCDDKVDFKDFESFITHLSSTEHPVEAYHGSYQKESTSIKKTLPCFGSGMMMHPKVPTDAEAEAPTWVWWDINRCPVPAKVDVCTIGPCIKRAVNNLGYMGPLTIIAVGILTDVSVDVLRAIYSSGIALHHVPTDMSGINDDLFLWRTDNPYPTNFMLLSGERVFGSTLASLESKGCNIIRSLFPYDACKVNSALNLSFTSEGCFFLWHSLLKILNSDVDEFEEEMVGSALVCATCEVDVEDFESFIIHLYSKEHGLEELQFYPQACGSYENEDATMIRNILGCFRAGIKSCERKAEDELKAELERKDEEVEG